MSEQSQIEQTEYGIFWGKDIYNYNEEKKPIIENILYERDCICIDSKAGVGKSLLAKTLICNLTTGTPFLDTYHISEPRNVLYVQTEGDRAETLERLSLITACTPIDDSRWVHMNWDGLTLNSKEGFATFMKAIRTPNMMYDVVIIDPLYTTVKGSLSSDEVAIDWIRNMRTVRGEFNCAFIVLHHEGKEAYTDGGKEIKKGDAHIFGSTYWSAFLNQNFKLKAMGDGHLRLVRGKQRNSKIVDAIDMKLLETDTMLKFTNKDELSNLKTVVIFEIIDKCKGLISAKEIIKKTDIPPATVYRCISRLIGEKRVEKVKVKYGYNYQVIRHNDK